MSAVLDPFDVEVIPMTGSMLPAQILADLAMGEVRYSLSVHGYSYADIVALDLPGEWETYCHPGEDDPQIAWYRIQVDPTRSIVLHPADEDVTEYGRAAA